MAAEPIIAVQIFGDMNHGDGTLIFHIARSPNNNAERTAIQHIRPICKKLTCMESATATVTRRALIACDSTFSMCLYNSKYEIILLLCGQYGLFIVFHCIHTSHTQIELISILIIMDRVIRVNQLFGTCM